MGFSRQEYWSGFPLPSPGDLPDPGVKPRSPALQADSFSSEPPGKRPVNTSVCLWSVEGDNEWPQLRKKSKMLEAEKWG